MHFIIVGLSAAITTCVASPLIRRWLIRHDVLDRPNERSSHRVPVPRGGGIACLLGVATGSAVAWIAGQDVAWGVLLAALALALVGLADDRYQLAAAPRLVSQVIVGAVLGAALGGISWAAVGAVTLPLFVNVVNFMDGINGITALTFGLWGTVSAIAGAAYGAPALTTLGALTAGAALGFAPWNSPKARLFLGDVGSYLFGALAAGGILLGSSLDVPLVILVAPLSIYVLDVATALLRRAIRRVSLTQAHREHVYQRLVDCVSGTHLIVALWTTALALSVTVVVSVGSGWWRVPTVTTLFVAYLASVPLWRLVTARTRTSATNGAP